VHSFVIWCQSYVQSCKRIFAKISQSWRRPLLATRAFSWLKAFTRAFTFKTLLRHCAKQGAFSVIVQLQTSRRFIFSSNLEPELRSSITLGTWDMETLIFKEHSWGLEIRKYFCGHYHGCDEEGEAEQGGEWPVQSRLQHGQRQRCSEQRHITTI